MELNEKNLEEKYIKISDLPLINLCDCSIISIAKDTFLERENLKKLNLNNNQLTKIEDDSFDHLFNLNILRLSTNRLETISQNAFRHMSHLTELGLSFNKLTKLDPYVFSSLKNLTYLGLHNNNLTHLDENLFSHLSNLTWLSLNDNLLENLSLGIFSKCLKLHRLSLFGNNFKKEQLDPKLFRGLKALQFLFIVDYKKNSAREYYNETQKSPDDDSESDESHLPAYDHHHRGSIATHSFKNRPSLRVISKLGEGTFGDVYLARIENESQDQVLKVLKHVDLDDQHLKMALSELDTFKRLNHENLVKYCDYFTDDYGTKDTSTICFINEYCKDGDLHDIIEKKKASEDYFHEETIYKWTLEMINALVYLHDRPNPIVHKDIKPANIFFHNNILKLGDYGVSVIIENFKSTISIQSASSLGYMCPEIFKDEPLTPKSDIWSAGVVIYEMAKLVKLFRFNVISEIMNFDVTNIHLDYVILQSLIKSMLKPNPNDRLNSKDLLEKLRLLNELVETA